MHINESVDRNSWMADLAMELYYLRFRRPFVDDFLDGVSRRLATGEQDYGNASFDRDPEAIIRELMDETLDRAGWCYVLERACRNRLAAQHDMPKPQQERLMRLCEAARQISVDTFEAYRRDSELLERKEPAHNPEDDGA